MIDYIIKLKRIQLPLYRDPWIWKMARRDARHNYKRLLLFAASLISGITAVVSLDLLNNSLQSDINRNARELVGADLVLSGNEPIDSVFKLMAPETDQAAEADMASMVLFKRTGDSRLIRLVAISDNYPFYGKITTKPASALASLRQNSELLLDESLAAQYEVSSGDTIQLGTRTFTVAGVVSEFPGGGGLMTSFTPSVYVNYKDLNSTGLIQFGSRVNYKNYFKIESIDTVQSRIAQYKTEWRSKGYSFETVETRKENLGQAFSSVYRFFALLAFIALILGCIGVASSVYIYAREKRSDVAILRCTGSSGWQAFSIYFVQVFSVGLISSVVGTLIGIGVQLLLPIIFKDIIPFEVAFGVSVSSIILGLTLGIVISALFSILPLLSIRSVSPLAVLRADPGVKTPFSWIQFAVITLIIVFPIAFGAWQTGSLLNGFLFFLAIAIALGLLTLTSKGLLFLARRFFPAKAGFVFRHSIASLFRPNNQTAVLLITIGLGAFILATLNITRQSLIAQVEFTGQESQSNTILFDIQPEQKDGVLDLMAKYKLPVNQLVPMVTCRIASIKGKPVKEWQKADRSKQKIPDWALTREYRVTYRNELTKSEKLLKGELQQLKQQPDSVWITLSEGMEETLGLTIGDSLEFDVQGVIIKAFIAGIRKVEWPKDPPNFIFAFPAGVLEAAPQIFVITSRIENQGDASAFQRELISGYSNVSLIDLRLILSTINDLFKKLSVVVQFLALFSVITGFIVLAGAVLNSKYLRQQEFVLLRTLGAKSWHIHAITLIEYGWVGLFATLSGVGLSLFFGWLLTTYFFEIEFAVDFAELGLLMGSIIFLTMFIGWYNSRTVIKSPPLQVLRQEV